MSGGTNEDQRTVTTDGDPNVESDDPGPVVFDGGRNESPDDEDDRRSTSMSESAGGASEDDVGFVLDEIHENPTGLDADPETDEFLVFKNTSERSIDLSGWIVENESGRTYRFPDGFVLDSGDRMTLRSGRGQDTDSDLHWGAGSSVWDDQGDTVTVETATGDPILSEPYKS